MGRMAVRILLSHTKLTVWLYLLGLQVRVGVTVGELECGDPEAMGMPLPKSLSQRHIQCQS